MPEYDKPNLRGFARFSGFSVLIWNFPFPLTLFSVAVLVSPD